MKYNLFTFVLLLLLGTASSSIAADPCENALDICDDISTVADGWSVIANALEETGGEDVGDLDVDRLVEDVSMVLEPTQLLGEALVALGNEKEENLGGDLLQAIEGLYDVDGDDIAAYLVDRMDDIVDALDNIVAYCDEE